MGIKRVVDTDLWVDEKVENFTPEEKFFWVYLLTNPFTRQLGIYKITKKQMAFQMGYDVDTIVKLLDRFEKDYKMIKYIENEVAIKNYLKYSIVKGGKPVEDCLLADLQKVKHRSLISWVFSELKTEDLNESVKKVMGMALNKNIESFPKESVKESVKETSKEFNDNDSIVDVSYHDSYHDSSTYRTPLYNIPLNIEGSFYPVYQEDIDFFQKLYPAVDVEQEVRNMIGWCDANPTKRKTYKGARNFINNWLTKRQDRGGSGPTSEERELKMDTQRAYIKDVEHRINKDNKKGDWFD